MQTDRVLLRIEEAAQALGISRAKTYQYVKAGELEVVHLGRSARVPAEAIDDFVRRLRAGNGNGPGPAKPPEEVMNGTASPAPGPARRPSKKGRSGTSPPADLRKGRAPRGAPSPPRPPPPPSEEVDVNLPPRPARVIALRPSAVARRRALRAAEGGA